MAFFAGIDGAVTWAGGYATGVYQFEINPEVDTEGYVNWDSADDYETILTGAKRWSGSFVAHMDSATPMPEIGTSGAATFRAAAATQTWSGTIVCQSMSNPVTFGPGAVEVTFNFVGSGTLTYPDGT